MNAQEVLLALVGNVVCGNVISDEVRNACTPEMLEEIYPTAARHAMEHLVGHAVVDFGLPENSALSQMKKTAMTVLYRQVQQAYETERATRALRDAEIPFIVLKGSVMQELYPEPWMRTKGDVDILIKEEHLNKAVATLVNKYDYVSKGKSDHDVFLCCPNGINIELHYDTIQKRRAINDCRNVLSQIWDYAQPVEADGYAYVLADEMFYFYHIAHMAKHFSVGGCGIRTFLDIWLLNHKKEFDREKREALLEEGGLLKFAKAAERVSEWWFSGADHTDLDIAFSDYVFRGDRYDGKENRAAIGQVRYGGKLKYFFTQRLFMHYDYLKAEYPILKEHRWLTPIFQVVRWTRLFKKSIFRRAMKEIVANTKVDEKDTASATDLVEYLGL